jgi:UDP-N-acetylmuramate dehydrogenase
LTGLEFAAGIWGSIGGAVYGNAGAFGSCMADIVLSAEVMDAGGQLREEPNEYFRFAYRHSRLKETKEIVTTVRLGLKPGSAAEIAARVAEIRDTRCGKHPTTACSAGCFFKNIDDPSQPHGKMPAGKLLDDIGAKEIRVGGAAVFDKHANIIVNTGTATSKDIRELADILKRKVKEKFNIDLVEEVISLGDF